MTILLYCVKLILVSSVLYGYYLLFLRNRPFHRFNRVYLLLATVLSLVLPLLVIPVSLPFSTEKGIDLTQTLRVIVPGDWKESEMGDPGTGAAGSGWSLSACAGLLYGIGVLVCGFSCSQSLRYIASIRKSYSYKDLSGIRLYDTAEPGTPFSFFRQIFWNRYIPTDTPEGQQIFRHELYHVRQRHSFDILFMELCCCLAWFNPFFRRIKKELRTIHEFLADEYALREEDRLDYAELLIQHALRQRNGGLVHPFSHFEIKRRILMITRSGQLPHGGLRNRVLVIPVLLLLVGELAFKPASTPGHPIAGPVSQELTVVIDAGHGGSDPGAIKGNIQEKDITLRLAQKVSQLAEQYHVQVILTRDRDELPGGGTDKEEGLRRRTEIAQTHKADLFISLHVNNTGDGPAPPSGIEAYVSARRADKNGTLLAGALLQQLSSIYTTSPNIKQRSSSGIYVLDHCPCPAVILECGSLSWPQDRVFITNEDNQEKVARKILEGVVQYQGTRGS